MGGGSLKSGLNTKIRKWFCGSSICRPKQIFFLDSLPFQEGTFEIDFKSDMYLKSVKLNREGLRGKEGKYFHRGTAKFGHLVAAENWTKITRP